MTRAADPSKTPSPQPSPGLPGEGERLKPLTSAQASSGSSGVTWRSILLGTISVIAVCGLTPLNDLTVNDTSLCAGYMPLAAVLILFLLVVGINAPLHRWFPRRALRSGELAVIVLMTLVACGLPNWGLMRFFVPSPIAPFHVGAGDQQFWRSFLGMDLPHWLFPVADVKGGRTSPIAQWFYNKVPEGERIPYHAWLLPLATWGIFAGAMLATLAAMARLLIDQWAVNERLPFPLVQVHAALIEQPAPGRSLNAMFRSPVLWIGLGGVLAIHMLTCLNAYFPRHFPAIPLRFDLTNIFSEEPFIYLRPKLKKALLSFTVVGVTFFIRSRAAFSLWAVFIIVNLIEMQQGMRQYEIPSAAWQDQHLGSCVAFIGGILWIGRHHWMRVLRSAFGRRDHGERAGYAASFWIAVAGTAVMLGWLWIVGVHLWVAVLIVAFILAAHLVVARVVAETGLPFYRSGINASQVYGNFSPQNFSTRDIYFGSVFNVLGPLTTRDGLTTFATTGLGVCKATGVEDGGRRRLGGAIALALIVGFFVAFFATLHCQYSYPTPGSQEARPQRNYFGAEYIPRRDVASAVDQFAQGRFAPKQHNPYVHMSIGFVATVLLQVASLRWAAWPLLPVGYVASYGAFVENAWFSIFVGWLAQVLIVRFGGASLFQKAKPFFVGIIFGEGLAAGIWLIVNAIVVMNGGMGQSVKFLL
jgi:hypothetical protein